MEGRDRWVQQRRYVSAIPVPDDKPRGFFTFKTHMTRHNHIPGPDFQYLFSKMEHDPIQKNRYLYPFSEVL